MSNLVAEVMTPDPITMPADRTAVDAARVMKDADVGTIIITDETDGVCGIATDRDIAVRVVAEGRDPQKTRLGDLATQNDIAVVAPNDPIDKAVQIMRERAIRRLPVVDKGRAVGIVSLGDLAQDRDPASALADISQAPPNN